jgi:anti-sigma B factor antagonist
MTDYAGDDALSVSVSADGAIVVNGDIDIAGGPVLEAAITRPDQGFPIVIDLENVFFVDSSGLRSLLGASRKAKANDSHVALRSVGSEVARLLEITGTTGQFVIESSRA